MSEWALRRAAEERKRWELVRDDVVHGALEWEGMARRRAVLSAGGASWRIGRAGAMRTSFDITDAATGTAVGTFALGGVRSGGTLELPPQAYRWRRVSALKSWRALERGDDEVARFQAHGAGRERVRIAVADGVAAEVQPLPLVLLACSFVAIVQKSDEDGAAAGAVAASA